METKALLKYARISPRKARLVTEMIRDKQVEDARNILRFCQKGAARVIGKVLDSAIHNAEQLGTIDVDTLHVKTAAVDVGPTWKRARPRAMGRRNRILKRTSHIRIVLEER